MPHGPIYYRPLKGYKYLLAEQYTIATPIRPSKEINTAYITLTLDGALTIVKDYAWDGPSGPTIDTPDAMIGSLVHDALYQLMRMGLLDTAIYREQADDLLQALCVEDGMSEFRAWYWHAGVREFGGSNAYPRPSAPDEQTTVIKAP